MDTTGRPRTVRGTAVADRYDVVLPNEHLHGRVNCWSADCGASAELDTGLQDGLDFAGGSLLVGELHDLRRLGRVLLVDPTTPDAGRNAEWLADLSEASGVDILMGCGRRVTALDGDEDAVACREAILAEFSTPAPRPAIIGEIGTGDPREPVEVPALVGAAAAQGALGVALYVHLHPWGRRGHEVLDAVERAGGDVSRTVLCHLDSQIPMGLGYHRGLLRRGCLIALDSWGDEARYGEVRMPTDEERVAALLALLDDGFGPQLLHSHGLGTKARLRRFGGVGLTHVPRLLEARLRAVGATPEEIHDQVAGNALRLLAGARHASRRTAVSATI